MNILSNKSMGSRGLREDIFGEVTDELKPEG
jgi:hypothetical protein